MDLTASPLLTTTRASSSPLLAAVASFRTSTPRHSPYPVDISQSLFSSASDDEDNITVVPVPEPDNDVLPSTQQLAGKLAELRQVAEEPPPPLTSRLKTENDDLRSENVALRLQRDADQEERRRLEMMVAELRRDQEEKRRLETLVEELQREIAALRSPPLLSPILQPSSATSLQPPPVSQPTSADDAPFTLVESRKQREARKREAAALVAAAYASDAVPSPPATSLNSNAHTVHVFHDSNVTCSPQDILTQYKNIIRQNNSNKQNININLMPTYTLLTTRNAIRNKTFTYEDKQTKRTITKPITFKHTDTVIIHILTNDARQTKHRHARSTTTTTNIQKHIIQLLTAHLPSSQITFIEAPPLLTSSSSDILPYNLSTRATALSLGAKFAETLVGEEHLWNDGFHINFRHRHLLTKTIAAAAAATNPHAHFGLKRPPLGHFGPWTAPRGRGMARPPSHKDVAAAAPYLFRRQKYPHIPGAGIPPLMDLNILPLR